MEVFHGSDQDFSNPEKEEENEAQGLSQLWRHGVL